MTAREFPEATGRVRLLIVEEPARGAVRCSWCRNRTGVSRVLVSRSALALCDRCVNDLMVQIDEPREMPRGQA